VQSKSKPLHFLLGIARNSPWLLTAVLLHVILGFAMAVVYVKQHFEKEEKGTIQAAVSTSGEVAAEPIVQPPEQIDRKAIPKNTEAELVSYEEQSYAPIEEAVEEQDLHMDVGDPNALDDLPTGATGGTGIGVGSSGHYASGGPSAYSTRRAGGGGKGRAVTGPTQGTEKSVLEGLRWLVRHQSEDGAWHAATLREQCSERKCIADDVVYPEHFDEGLTGLALLAFLGAGFGHDAKQDLVDTAMGEKYRIGDVVKNGLKWLKDRQRENGAFSERGFMYNEALASMAMSEAYGLTGSRYWKEPAEKSVAYLVAAQKIAPHDGGPWGWRYGSLAEARARKERGEIDEATFFVESQDADISVTCWVIMALKSARLSGLEVPEHAFEGGWRFAEYVTGREGMVGYLNPEMAGDTVSGVGDHYQYHPGVMSALGMLVRTFVRHDLSDPALELGAKYILRDQPAITDEMLSVDYYYWYYATLALHQFDGPDSPREGQTKGDYWKPWNEAMIETLLELQDENKERDICSRGGWLAPDRWGMGHGGPIYATAISTLTLEVYYRYENAFGMAKEAKPVEAAEPEPAAVAAPEAPAEGG
jgi:hypothetical protein